MCFPTKLRKYVSTHSRPKAAGFGGLGGYRIDIVSTHSRPKAAGICFTLCRAGCGLFQLTAARRRLGFMQRRSVVVFMRFNSQPPEGGWEYFSNYVTDGKGFQLTAARRRLGSTFQAFLAEYAAFQLTAARRRLEQAAWSL